MKILILLAVTAAGALTLAACGLDVEAPDLFLLTRTGAGRQLTLLVNDAGTISCDGAKAKTLSSSLLIQARDLADDLQSDAQAKLDIPRSADSVSYYTIKLEPGTIRFPDTAGARHHELAEAELFALQAAQQACGLSG